MTAEQNLAIIRDLLAAMRQHDVEKGVSFYAKDCVIDIVPLEQPIRGREGLAAAWRMAWSGFPDQYYKEDRMFPCGDYVLFEGVMGGTHEGTYLNIPPTDKHLEWRVAFIWKIVDGKVQEWHSYWDAAYLLRQLGIIPLSSRLPLERP